MKFKYYLLALITLFINDSNTASFMPDETVHLSNNAFCEIQNLSVGSETISFDGKKLVTDKVTRNQVKDCDNCIKITFQGADLTVSQDQLLYLPKNNQWVAAKDLKPRDLALSINGDWIPVLATEQLKGVKRLHDLTIADQHNLFISKLGILAHNEPVTFAYIVAAAVETVATVVGTYAAEATVAATVCLVGHELTKQSDIKKSDSKNTGSDTQTQEFLKPYESGATLLTPDAYLHPKTAAVPKTKEASTAPLTRVTPPSGTLQKKEAAPVIQATPTPATHAQPGSVEGKDQTAAPEKPVDEKDTKKSEDPEEKKGGEEKKLTDAQVKELVKEITKDSILEEDKHSKIFAKPEEDASDMDKDFDSLPLDEVTEKETAKGPIRVGEFSNGWKAVARHSTDGRPTLEIQTGNRHDTKIRYGSK